MLLVVAAVFASILQALAAPAQAAGPCEPPSNAIVCENSKPGAPQGDWMVGGDYGDILGYGTAASVQPGEALPFKVKTPSSAYHIEIFRLGWYGGLGARRMTTVTPNVGLPQNQPNCLTSSSTGLVDCGNWAVSATWSVPSTAVSGYYVANFIRDDAIGVSQFPFIVRSDSSTSELLVQASDQSWQAYNRYGGNSTYEGTFAGSSDGRAYKVSFNRPYLNSGTANFMNAELPFLRWVERNGYDVSYVSGVDTSRNPSLLLNHETFISSGHDEYWNQAQRAGVEAARAAGVNLAFFSGNEMFWKTRFEPSIDASATPYRTLVTYKETKAGAKIDPSPEWTGTWRDPRLSPPSDGGRPENAVTGTLFRINGYVNDSITVSSQFANQRFWRNTSVANLAPGQTATFPAGTLGYEWDEYADNGFRPAGSVALSSTTVTKTTGQLVLLDYGNEYGTGTATHSLVLYRASSGALVFGAGTVQWAWGLDDLHLFPGPPVDVRMQQATVNLFADMGAQPQTLQSGLVAATKSTDTAGPASTITAPAAGSTVPAGSAQTITGTATDSGGGVAAAVEVSVDNGVNYRRATPTGTNGSYATWSYGWTPSTIGQTTIRVRASDDSANIGAVASANVTVGSQVCPCTVFGSAVPTTVDAGDTGVIELGTRFQASANGVVNGVRFYKSAANTGTHTGSLWTATGTLLATGTFTGESASGWQTLTFPSPVSVSAGTQYVVSYRTNVGRYSGDQDYFTGKGAGSPPLTAPASTTGAPNGLFKYGGGFPTDSFRDTNYWVDVVFNTSGADTTAPTVTSVSPTAGATGISPGASVSATFSELVVAGSLQMTVTRQGGAAVTGAVTLSGDGRTATFTPSAALAASTVYNASVRATDGSGNQMASAFTWSFTTGTTPPPGACPCTLFGNTVPNLVDSGDNGAIELGVRFQVSANASVSGVRFYKSAANTGTHTGSLWTTSGTLLATGTFAGESASGWQTLTFASPVAITAGTQYIVSYRTSVGRYSADQNYFTGKGAGTAPLTAPASTTSALNGLYRYGGGFPTDSFRDTNYWVDPVVNTTASDTTPPSVSSVSPAAGATAVSISTAVSATFSELVVAGSLQMTLTRQGGAAVTGAVTLSGDGRTATFTPTAALAASTVYNASVRATDGSGNQMASAFNWSFTTGATPPPGACPCTLFGSTVPPVVDAGDASLIELGVRFQSSANALVTGVRFYKSAANTGTHTGSLWTTTGTLLATGTFSGESVSGWQTLTFATAVGISAGTQYIVSYQTTAGRYSASLDFFTGQGAGSAPLTSPASTTTALNGLFRYGGGFPTDSFRDSNYWVDVTIDTAGADTTPPVVTTRSPSAGATAVALDALVTANFNERVDPNTLAFTLTGPGGAAVPSDVSLSTDGRVATLNPASNLASQTSYSASVTARDLLGNTAAPVVWSFTTSSTTSTCPCTLFRTTDAPTSTANEGQGVNLGMAVRTSVNGTVTGVRFYKAAGDTGVHTGTLWSSTGLLLGTGTFSGETASGWQTLTFTTPVAVTAGTTYVVSFFSPQGRFGYTRNYFNVVRTNGPLTAPATSTTQGNGLYRYGSASAFPVSSGNGTNYFVDLVFQTA